jgi:hypothetical protein
VTTAFVGLAYQGKDIVLRLIIEYKGFWPVGSRSFFYEDFLKYNSLACVET